MLVCSATTPWRKAQAATRSMRRSLRGLGVSGLEDGRRVSGRGVAGRALRQR